MCLGCFCRRFRRFELGPVPVRKASIWVFGAPKLRSQQAQPMMCDYRIYYTSQAPYKISLTFRHVQSRRLGSYIIVRVKDSCTVGTCFRPQAFKSSDTVLKLWSVTQMRINDSRTGRGRILILTFLRCPRSNSTFLQSPAFVTLARLGQSRPQHPFAPCDETTLSIPLDGKVDPVNFNL